jgi:uncharacterized protein (TIGR03083 family)
MKMTYDRFCTEIVTQTNLLTAAVENANLSTPVPTCPGWNLGQLLRHLGGGHRWVESIVRTRATGPTSDEQVRDLPAHRDEDPTRLAAWVTEGAETLATTLRAAGPDAQVWTPVPRGAPTPVFHARRMTHETAVHRADATLALGAAYTLAADVAIDAVDEWMELGSLPEIFDVHPEKREMLGPDRTLAFQATDIAPELNAGWGIDLTGDVIRWRRSLDAATVTVRGPLTDLLLVIYRRRTADVSDVEIAGDQKVFDHWLDLATFG